MLKQCGLSLLFLLMSAHTTATVIEEVIEVPVSVRNMYGQEVSQRIKVTVFRDDQRMNAPYLVLNHGRPANGNLAGMQRQRYSENSRYFVSLGFAVLVPTRVGYGESGGPDVEDSGRCDSRQYPPAYAAAADQTIAVLKHVAGYPYVNAARGIVVGQSFGGATAIALSAREVPGMVAAVNFAGGGGGDPVGHPGVPCSAYRMTAMFRSYGTTAKVPTLWLYSENDQFWGKKLPLEWLAAYTGAGGKGEFVQLPPYKEDGHASFVGNRAAWQPAFEQFLRKLDFLPASP